MRHHPDVAATVLGVDVLRYAAFTDTPSGGNPAGVVLDAGGLSAETMQAVAAEVGYSETAFLVQRGGDPTAYDVRYFAPAIEVPFCGHATIASGVALLDDRGPATYAFHTPAGLIAVDARREDGRPVATLTSAVPHVEEPPAGLVGEVLEALHWSAADLDPALPPRIAFAGVRHLILAAGTRERLARLDYDVDGLRQLMEEQDLTTVGLVWREAGDLFHARHPFPVGGVVEDPATGAGAAALGAYLRALGEVEAPVRITVVQGVDMGRPSRLVVDVDAGREAVRVTGQAVPIAG